MHLCFVWELQRLSRDWAFWLLAHAIKTTVDCVSMSSKCTYVLNGSGETAQVRRLVWAFVARTCNKNHRRLRDLLIFWIRVVKTLARHFLQTRPKLAAREEFFQRLSERIHSGFGKKNVRKIQNAAVIPATETENFLDLFSFNFQENVYFRFLKLHRRRVRCWC